MGVKGEGVGWGVGEAGSSEAAWGGCLGPDGELLPSGPQVLRADFPEQHFGGFLREPVAPHRWLLLLAAPLWRLGGWVPL